MGAASNKDLPTLPRRILMTADTIGGVWDYALELAQGLSRCGVETVLATMGRPLSEAQKSEVGRLPDLTLCESDYRLEWMEDPWEDVERASQWLLSLAQQYQVDLVHLNGYVHGALPWSCPCLVVAHSCVLSWWEAVKKEPPPPRLQHYRERVSAGLSAAQAFAAPSSAMLETVRRLYLPPERGYLIYNARSAARYRPGAKGEFILSVGRLWDEAKNVALLSRAAPELPWPVYVAGEDHHPEGERHILPHLKQLGLLPSERLASWYSSAAIYALPARYEPFGLTVLEAALCGCALVLGDIPSLRELWEGAAVFVNPEDSGALARELATLCRDTRRREELAQKALARSNDYTPGRMTAQYLSVYSSLLSAEAASPPVAGAAGERAGAR